MNDLKKVSINILNTLPNTPRIINAFLGLLQEIECDVNIKITVEVMDDITKFKKRYFAMVTELAKYAGYTSHKDRELFKVQVREQIKIKSMVDIDNIEEVALAIEAIHQLAGDHYHYTFKQDGPGINFNTRESREK